MFRKIVLVVPVESPDSPVDYSKGVLIGVETLTADEMPADPSVGVMPLHGHEKVQADLLRRLGAYPTDVEGP